MFYKNSLEEKRDVLSKRIYGEFTFWQGAKYEEEWTSPVWVKHKNSIQARRALGLLLDECIGRCVYERECA